MKRFYYYILAIVVLSLTAFYFFDRSRQVKTSSLPQAGRDVRDLVNKSASVDSHTPDLSDSLSFELAGVFAARDFAHDAMKRMQQKRVVDLYLKRFLIEIIKNSNREARTNKFKGVKYYREDYKKQYSQIENGFYDRYPHYK